ncbi:DUF7146 domain-containing protein [Rubellimicrobium rubrum]|uniref:DUF7146 domain-containing protein n=1 Tax=Rubellimicrobium rubrum TaxID=2585369 RepID=UPI001FE62473|nr:hypothetical protein [Rubellimicrobium rubrum]
MTDARALTHALKGRWYGRYGVARCPAQGDRNPSLSLSNGNNGRLLLRCRVGCAFSDILAALRGLGLIEGNGPTTSMDATALARREAEDRADAQRRALQASALWREARLIEGTSAETYLRGRGISCTLPPTLRFHPHASHPTGQRLPAIVARVERADWMAVHRTFLRPDGNGKAEVQTAKAMLGSVRAALCASLTDRGRWGWPRASRRP